MGKQKVATLMSEDDVRTKIVYEWLKDCGFTQNEINLEYSINIRIGRNVRTIHSRADILVRDSKGHNLLIIEVKKSDHTLDQSDKKQALSYGRALADGEIAPFTILTNGSQTQIFDTITGKELNGKTIDINHPYIKAGFKVSGDVIGAYSEALNYLISISSDNLMEFCRGQVEERMKLLKSNDIMSGKKYIPQLYIERKNTKIDLNEKLFNKEVINDLLLIVGPPQHGKTSFLCHSVDEFLEQNIPCLFFPAISLKKGLLYAIQEDFSWSFAQNLSTSQIARRLNKILDNFDGNLLIFVDGWNEMISDALFINDECQKLCNGKIKVILSTTSPSLNRLLIDEADNPCFIADKINVNSSQIRSLSNKPLKNTKNIGLVQIGKFDYEELQIASKTYGEHFNVTFHDDSNLPKDPFYLRLASEQFTNSIVPAFSTRSDLIKESLRRKGRRANINDFELFTGLNQIANVVFNNDSPFQISMIPACFSDSRKLSQWLECAILLETNDNHMPEIDFYYTHDKDYSIAILNRDWPQILKVEAKDEDIWHELSLANATEAGKSALTWFLSCPDYFESLEVIFNNRYFNFEINGSILQILSESILNQVNLNQNLTFNWLDKHLQIFIDIEGKNSNIENSQIPILIYSLIQSIDQENEYEKYKLWMKCLLKYDDSIQKIGIEESYVHQVYGEDIRGYYNYDESLLDVTLFTELVHDKDVVIASNAALFLAYTSPDDFMENFKYYINELVILKHNYKDILQDACERLSHDLSDMIYGDHYCKGIYYHCEVGDIEMKEEYIKLKPLLIPIIKTYLHTKVGDELLELLENLRYKADIHESLEESLEDIFFEDPNQLKFDL